MPEPLSDAEIETQRLQSVEEYGDQGAIDSASPGSMYAHEALHMAAFMMNSVEGELMQHAAVLRSSEWFKLAHQAHEMLFRLYQAIGNEHLSVVEHAE